MTDTHYIHAEVTDPNFCSLYIQQICKSWGQFDDPNFCGFYIQQICKTWGQFDDPNFCGKIINFT
jgi:hypothetical protein